MSDMRKLARTGASALFLFLVGGVGLLPAWELLWSDERSSANSEVWLFVRSDYPYIVCEEPSTPRIYFRDEAEFRFRKREGFTVGLRTRMNGDVGDVRVVSGSETKGSGNDGDWDHSYSGSSEARVRMRHWAKGTSYDERVYYNIRRVDPPELSRTRTYWHRSGVWAVDVAVEHDGRGSGMGVATTAPDARNGSSRSGTGSHTFLFNYASSDESVTISAEDDLGGFHSITVGPPTDATPPTITALEFRPARSGADTGRAEDSDGLPSRFEWGSEAEWTPAGIMLAAVTAHDHQSGLESIEVAQATGPGEFTTYQAFSDYQKLFSWSWGGFTMPHNTDLRVRATDRAGNESEVTVPIDWIDRTDPERPSVEARNEQGEVIESGSWSGSDVTVRATANDEKGTDWVLHSDASGIERIVFSPNPGETVTRSASDNDEEEFCEAEFSVTREGETEATVTAYDKAGNSRDKEVTVRIDHTAPEVSITHEDQTEGRWVSGNVSLDVFASCGLSGVNPERLHVTAYGVSEVDLERAGLDASSADRDILRAVSARTLDLTEPLRTWTHADFSGTSGRVTVSDNGLIVVRGKAQDSANPANEGEGFTVVRIDSGMPTIEYDPHANVHPNIDPHGGWTRLRRINFENFAFSDGSGRRPADPVGSGIARAQWRVPEEDSDDTFEPADRPTVELGPDGGAYERRLQLKVVDGAGNETTEDFTFQIDREPPEIDGAEAWADGALDRQWFDDDYAVVLDLDIGDGDGSGFLATSRLQHGLPAARDDGGSGVDTDRWQWRVFGEGEWRVPNDGEIDLGEDGANLDDGLHTVEFRVFDNVGNEVTRAFPVLLDRSAPTFSVVDAFAGSDAGYGLGQADDNWTNAEEVTITLQIVDEFLAVGDVEVALQRKESSDSIQWQPVSNAAFAELGPHDSDPKRATLTVDLTAEGRTDVWVRPADQLGNRARSVVGTVRIDRTRPTVNVWIETPEDVSGQEWTRASEVTVAAEASYGSLEGGWAGKRAAIDGQWEYEVNSFDLGLRYSSVSDASVRLESPGRHRVTFSTEDEAGNIGSASFEVWMDDVVPGTLQFQPEPYARGADDGGVLTLGLAQEIDARDEVSGIDGEETRVAVVPAGMAEGVVSSGAVPEDYRWYGFDGLTEDDHDWPREDGAGRATWGENGERLTLPGTADDYADGAYALVIEVRDRAGNARREARSFTMDQTPPEIEEIAAYGVPAPDDPAPQGGELRVPATPEQPSPVRTIGAELTARLRIGGQEAGESAAAPVATVEYALPERPDAEPGDAEYSSRVSELAIDPVGAGTPAPQQVWWVLDEEQADGTWYLFARVRDEAGNVSEPVVMPFAVDRSELPRPTIASTTHVDTSGWFSVHDGTARNDPRFTVSPPATTAGTGVSEYAWELWERELVPGATGLELDRSEGAGRLMASGSHPADQGAVLAPAAELEDRRLADNPDRYTFYVLEVRALNAAGVPGEPAEFAFFIDTERPANLTLRAEPFVDSNAWYAAGVAELSWERPKSMTEVREYAYRLFADDPLERHDGAEPAIPDSDKALRELDLDAEGWIATRDECVEVSFARSGEGGDEEPLAGELHAALIAEDHAGNREVDVRLLRFDRVAPRLAELEPGGDEVAIEVDADGERAMVAWGEPENDEWSGVDRIEIALYWLVEGEGEGDGSGGETERRMERVPGRGVRTAEASGAGQTVYEAIERGRWYEVRLRLVDGAGNYRSYPRTFRIPVEEGEDGDDDPPAYWAEFRVEWNDFALAGERLFGPAEPERADEAELRDLCLELPPGVLWRAEEEPGSESEALAEVSLSRSAIEFDDDGEFLAAEVEAEELSVRAGGFVFEAEQIRVDRAGAVQLLQAGYRREVERGPGGPREELLFVYPWIDLSAGGSVRPVGSAAHHEVGPADTGSALEAEEEAELSLVTETADGAAGPRLPADGAGVWRLVGLEQTGFFGGRWRIEHAALDTGPLAAAGVVLAGAPGGAGSDGSTAVRFDRVDLDAAGRVVEGRRDGGSAPALTLPNAEIAAGAVALRVEAIAIAESTLHLLDDGFAGDDGELISEAELRNYVVRPVRAAGAAGGGAGPGVEVDLVEEAGFEHTTPIRYDDAYGNGYRIDRLGFQGNRIIVRRGELVTSSGETIGIDGIELGSEGPVVYRGAPIAGFRATIHGFRLESDEAELQCGDVVLHSARLIELPRNFDIDELELGLMRLRIADYAVLESGSGEASFGSDGIYAGAVIHGVSLEADGLFARELEVPLAGELRGASGQSDVIFEDAELLATGLVEPVKSAERVRMEVAGFEAHAAGAELRGGELRFGALTVLASDERGSRPLRFGGLRAEAGGVTEAARLTRPASFSAYGYTVDLREGALDAGGLRVVAGLAAPAGFGRRVLEFADARIDPADAPDAHDVLESGTARGDSVLRIGGHRARARRVRLSSEGLVVPRADVELPVAPGGDRPVMEIEDVAIAPDGTVARAGGLRRDVEFVAANGFAVSAERVEVGEGQLSLAGKVHLPEALGRGGAVEYREPRIFLDRRGVVSAPASREETEYQISGFDAVGREARIEEEGVHFDTTTVELFGVTARLPRLSFYADGELRLAGRALRPVDLPIFGGRLTVSSWRIVEDGLAARAVVALPPELGALQVSFDPVVFRPDGSLRTAATVPQIDYERAGFAVAMRNLSLDEEGLRIESAVLTLPEELESRRVYLRDVYFDHEWNLHGGAAGADPVPLWGFTLHPEELRFQDGAICFAGSIRTPSRWNEPLGGRRIEVVQLRFTPKGELVELDIRAAEAFEVDFVGDSTFVFEGLGVELPEGASRPRLAAHETSLRFPEESGMPAVRMHGLTLDPYGGSERLPGFEFDRVTIDPVKTELYGVEFVLRELTLESSGEFAFSGTAVLPQSMPEVLAGGRLDVRRLAIEDGRLVGLEARLEDLDGPVGEFVDIRGGRVELTAPGDDLVASLAGQVELGNVFPSGLRGRSATIGELTYSTGSSRIVAVDVTSERFDAQLFGAIDAEEVQLRLESEDEGRRFTIDVSGAVMLPDALPSPFGGSEVEIERFVLTDAGAVRDLSVVYAQPGRHGFVAGTEIADPRMALELDEESGRPLLDASGSVWLGSEFPNGLSGTEIELSELVYEPRGGVHAAAGVARLADTELFGGASLLGGTVGVEGSDGELFFDVSGTLALPPPFSQGEREVQTRIGRLLLAADGTVHEADIGFEARNTTVFDAIDVEQIEARSRARDGELVIDGTLDARLPESLPGDLTGAGLAGTFEYVAGTGMESFELASTDTLEAPLPADLTAEFDTVAVGVEGVRTSGGVRFPDSFPKGLAGVRIDLTELQIGWDGTVTKVEGRLGYAAIEIAGFNADLYGLELSADGVSIDRIDLEMPPSVYQGRASLVDAGYDRHGGFYGDFEMDALIFYVAGVRVTAEGPDLEIAERRIAFDRVALVLPEIMGGAHVEVAGFTASPGGVRIAGGGVELPCFEMPGGLGFSGIYLELELDGGTYSLAGGGSASVPGLGLVSAEISLTNVSGVYPWGLRYGRLEFQVDGLGIPVGGTGIYVNGLRGAIAFGPPGREMPVRLQGMAGGTRIMAGLFMRDATGSVTGDTEVWVNLDTFEWAVSGEFAVLEGLVEAGVLAMLTNRYGFYGELRVRITYIRGRAWIQVWREDDTYVAGGAEVKFGIPEKIIGGQPRNSLWLGPIGAEFGTFVRDGDLVSGVMGYVDPPVIGRIGAFVSSDGIELGSMRGLALYGDRPPGAASFSIASPGPSASLMSAGSSVVGRRAAKELVVRDRRPGTSGDGSSDSYAFVVGESTAPRNLRGAWTDGTVGASDNGQGEPPEGSDDAGHDNRANHGSDQDGGAEDAGVQDGGVQDGKAQDGEGQESGARLRVPAGTRASAGSAGGVPADGGTQLRLPAGPAASAGSAGGAPADGGDAGGEGNPIERIIFSLEFEAGDPELVAIAPDGSRYGADHGRTESARYEDFVGLAVLEPEPGEWQVEVNNLTDDVEYTLEVGEKGAVPEVMLEEPSGAMLRADAGIRVAGRAGPAGRGGVARVYAGQEPGTGAGRTIGELEIEPDGRFAGTVSTRELAPGDYYLSVRAALDGYAPVRADSQTRVEVRPSGGAEPIPKPIVSWGTGGTIRVEFTDPTPARARGYTVVVRPAGGAEGGGADGAAVERFIGDMSTVRLPGFDPGRAYEVSVRAVEHDGAAGPEGECALLPPRDSMDVDGELELSLSEGEPPVVAAGAALETTLEARLFGGSSGGAGAKPQRGNATEHGPDLIEGSVRAAPEGFSVVYEERSSALTSGDGAPGAPSRAELPVSIAVPRGAAPGRYEVTLEAAHLVDRSVRAQTVMELDVVHPEPKLGAVYPEEWHVDRTAEIELEVSGRGFAPVSRFYLDDRELVAREQGSGYAVLELPDEVESGTRTLSVRSGDHGDGETGRDERELTVIAPSYRVVAYNSYGEAAAGERTRYYLGAEGRNGFEGPVRFSLEEVPEGVSAELVRSTTSVFAGAREARRRTTEDLAIVELTARRQAEPVVVRADNGVTVALSARVEAEPPATIASLRRYALFPGEEVVAFGYGFGEDPVVRLSGEELKVHLARDDLVVARIPDGATTGLLAVEGPHGHSEEVRIVVRETGFGVYPEQERVRLEPGERTELPVAVTGHAPEVELAASVSADEIAAALDRAWIVPNDTVTATVSAAGDAEPGVYRMQIAGEGNGYHAGATVEVEVGAAFAVGEVELPYATAGRSYAAEVRLDGGVDPVRFEAKSGLPAGLELTGAGLVRGRPAEPGRYEIAVAARDGEERLAEGTLGLTVVDNAWETARGPAGGARANPVAGPASDDRAWTVHSEVEPEMLLAGGGLVFAAGAEGLATIDAGSGTLRYTVPQAVAEAHYAPEVLLVLFADGTLSAREPHSGYVRWERDGVAAFVHAGEELFVASEDGDDRAVRLDPDTGTVRGEAAFSPIGAREAGDGRVLRARGRVLEVLDSDGGAEQLLIAPAAIADWAATGEEIFVVAGDGTVLTAGRDGSERARFDAGEAAHAGSTRKIAAGGGRIVLSGAGGVFVYDAESGALESRYPEAGDGAPAGTVGAAAAGGGDANAAADAEAAGGGDANAAADAEAAGGGARSASAGTAGAGRANTGSASAGQVAVAISERKLYTAGPGGLAGVNAARGEAFFTRAGAHRAIAIAAGILYAAEPGGRVSAYEGPANVKRPELEYELDPAAPGGERDYYVCAPTLRASAEDRETAAWVEIEAYSWDAGGAAAHDGAARREGGAPEKGEAGNGGAPENGGLIPQGAPNDGAAAPWGTSDNGGAVPEEAAGNGGAPENAWALDGGLSPQAGERPVELAGTLADGHYTLVLAARDEHGARSDRVYLPVAVDTTPPALDVERAGRRGGEGWYVEPVRFTAHAADEVSGVERIEYRVNDERWRRYTGPFEIGADGIHRVRFRAVDRAGNVALGDTETVAVDRTAPGVEHSIERAYGFVAVALAAGEGESGLERIEYRTGSERRRYTEPIVLREPGLHRIEARAADRAGNISAWRTFSVEVGAPAAGDLIYDLRFAVERPGRGIVEAQPGVRVSAPARSGGARLGALPPYLAGSAYIRLHRDDARERGAELATFYAAAEIEVYRALAGEAPVPAGYETVAGSTSVTTGGRLAGGARIVRRAYGEGERVTVAGPGAAEAGAPLALFVAPADAAFLHLVSPAPGRELTANREVRVRAESGVPAAARHELAWRAAGDSSRGAELATDGAWREIGSGLAGIFTAPVLPGGGGAPGGLTTIEIRARAFDAAGEMLAERSRYFALRNHAGAHPVTPGPGTDVEAGEPFALEPAPRTASGEELAAGDIAVFRYAGDAPEAEIAAARGRAAAQVAAGDSAEDEGPAAADRNGAAGQPEAPARSKRQAAAADGTDGDTAAPPEAPTRSYRAEDPAWRGLAPDELGAIAPAAGSGPVLIEVHTPQGDGEECVELLRFIPAERYRPVLFSAAEANEGRPENAQPADVGPADAHPGEAGPENVGSARPAGGPPGAADRGGWDGLGGGRTDAAAEGDEPPIALVGPDGGSVEAPPALVRALDGTELAERPDGRRYGMGYGYEAALEAARRAGELPGHDAAPATGGQAAAPSGGDAEADDESRRPALVMAGEVAWRYHSGSAPHLVRVRTAPVAHQDEHTLRIGGERIDLSGTLREEAFEVTLVVEPNDGILAVRGTTGLEIEEIEVLRLAEGQKPAGAERVRTRPAPEAEAERSRGRR